MGTYKIWSREVAQCMCGRIQNRIRFETLLGNVRCVLVITNENE